MAIVNIDIPENIKKKMILPFQYMIDVMNFTTTFTSSSNFLISVNIDLGILEVGNNNLLLVLRSGGKEYELRYNLIKTINNSTKCTFVHNIDEYDPVIPLTEIIEELQFRPNQRNYINVDKIERVLLKLRSSTNTLLKDIQRSKCPHIYDLDLKKVDRYMYGENEFLSSEVTFEVQNQKYIRRNDDGVIFKGPLRESIDRNIVYPFFIFHNDININIDNINILIDHRSIYLEILGFGNINYNMVYTNSIDISTTKKFILPRVDRTMVNNMTLDIQPASNIHTILLNGRSITPGNINSNALNNNGINVLEVTGTTLNRIGFSNRIPAMEFTIRPNNFECILIRQDVEIIDIESETDMSDFEFVLSNGGIYFDLDNIPKTGKGIKFDNINKLDIYVDSNSNNVVEVPQDSTYKIYPDTTFISNNGILYRDFKDHQNNVFETIDSSKIEYKSYYYRDNESLDNITRYDQMSNYIDKIRGTLDMPYLDNIIKPMDFAFQLGIPKIDRIFNIVEYLCKYNSHLLSEYIDDKSEISNKIFTGKEIKEESEKIGSNYKYIYDKYINLFEIVECMVFVNGILLNEDDIVRNLEENIITFKNLRDDDEIEFLIFNRVSNYVYPMEFRQSDKEYLIGNYIPFRDLQLTCYDINNHIYRNIPKIESLQYDISEHMEDLGRGYINLNLPEYYDNINVFLSSKRQFKHHRHVISNSDLMIKELYKIMIPDEFKFCNNRKQYLFFYNGRKMSYNDAQVCLNRWNLPFDKRFAHINKQCKIGDIIDIYYVPDEMEEIVFKDSVSDRGYITIPQLSLGYPISAEHTSIFVNGKKMTSNTVDIISNREVRVIEETGSTKNISVLKHITYSDEIFEMIRNFKSAWDIMTDSLTEEEKDEMFGFDIFLKDIDPNLRDNIYTRKQVLYEIIRRYWLVTGNKVKVECPMFYVSDINGQMVLTIDSRDYHSFDIAEFIIKIKRDYGITDTYINANDAIIEYRDLDVSSYTTVYNDGVTVLKNDSNLATSDIPNIIQILIRDLELDESTLAQFTVDAAMEYIIKYIEGSGIPIFNSINASIIHPYNYEKHPTMGSLKEYPVYPIAISAQDKQIMKLPKLYNTDMLGGEV